MKYFINMKTCLHSRRIVWYFSLQNLYSPFHENVLLFKRKINLDRVILGNTEILKLSSAIFNSPFAFPKHCFANISKGVSFLYLKFYINFFNFIFIFAKYCFFLATYFVFFLLKMLQNIISRDFVTNRNDQCLSIIIITDL
jgi:hypothetical protein